MAEFSVSLSLGLKRLLFENGGQRQLAQAVARTALDARELLADATPKDTGDTARRWQVAKMPTLIDATAVVSNDSEVMPYLEWGTGIYSQFPGAPREVIRPRNGKALGPMTFQGEAGVFLPYTRGIRPHFVVRDNLARIERMLLANADAALRGLLNG